MKTRIQIQSIPDAAPIPNATIAVRSLEDGGILDTITSDDDGFALLQRDGHLEPYYLHVTGQPGGDKFWRSDEMMTAGATSPQDWPIALRPLGNGVIAGYEGELEVTVSGTMATMQSGAALIHGHPVVFYTTRDMQLIRPATGFVFYVIAIEVYTGLSETTPGRAVLTYFPGEQDVAAVPDMIQTDEVYQLPLAIIYVPNAGTLSVLDLRQMLQPERHEPVTDEVVLDGPLVTDEAGGEALSGASISLYLPDEVTYDITARLSATQGPVAGSTNWTNTATYGPTFNSIAISNPGQIAVDSTGLVFIADTGNNRLLLIDDTGAFVGSLARTGITGVCIDSSDNVYVLYVVTTGRITKYTSSLVSQWDSMTFSGGVLGMNIATDSTHVYVSCSNDTVRKHLCSNGALVTSWGSSGSSNGQLSGPWGIATDGAHVWVIDSGNARIQKFTVAGAYVSKFDGINVNTKGAALDGAGSLLSAVDAFAILGYGWVQTISADTLTGLLSLFYPDQPSGLVVASGDIVWVTDTHNNTVLTWDEITTGAGYGQLAIDTDSDLGTYVGPGNRDASIKTVKTWTAQGGFGSQSVIRAFGKATSGEATFQSLVLSAEARPRR